MSNYSMIFSPTGGTRNVANLLMKAMGGEYSEIDLCAPVEACALGARDVCLVSVPSFGGRVPALAIERIKAISGNGAKAVLNCVYGNRAWEDTLTELQDTLEAQGFTCVAAVAAVAEHSIFRQFATGRPDAQDSAQLAEFGSRIREKLDAGACNMPALEGSHGTYKSWGGTPFKPAAGEKCDACGLCAKQCPVNAIDPADPRKTDVDKCITCMRCISVCPQQARQCDPQLMAERGEMMIPVLGGHKENFLFI